LKVDLRTDKNQYKKNIANLEKELSEKNYLLVEINNNIIADNNNDLVIIYFRKKNIVILNENILLKEEIKHKSDQLNKKIKKSNTGTE